MPNPQKTHTLMKAALGAVIIAIIILCVLLVQQYRYINRLDYISHRQSLFRSLHGSGPLTSANASSTQAWMTFDYINRAFTLPSQYLQVTLSINDSRYPRMTIAQYVKASGRSQNEVLKAVQDAIRAYASAKQ